MTYNAILSGCQYNKSQNKVRLGQKLLQKTLTTSAVKVSATSITVLTLVACGSSSEDGPESIFTQGNDDSTHDNIIEVADQLLDSVRTSTLSDDKNTASIISQGTDTTIKITNIQSNRLDASVIATGVKEDKGTLTFQFVDDDDLVILSAGSEIKDFPIIVVKQGTVDFSNLPEGMLDSVTLQLGSGAVLSIEQFLGVAAVEVRDGAKSGELAIYLKDQKEITEFFGKLATLTLADEIFLAVRAPENLLQGDQIKALADDGISLEIVQNNIEDDDSDSTVATDASLLIMDEPIKLQGAKGDFQDRYPQISEMNDENIFLVTWQGETSDGYDIFVQAFEFLPDGSGQKIKLLGEKIHLNSLQDGPMDQAPTISALADGGFVVVWQGASEFSQEWDIFVQRFDAEGKTLAEVSHLRGALGMLRDQAPQVSPLLDGEFVVTWEGLTSDGQGSDIFVQRFNADGAKDEPDLDVFYFEAVIGQSYTVSLKNVDDTYSSNESLQLSIYNGTTYETSILAFEGQTANLSFEVENSDRYYFEVKNSSSRGLDKNTYTVEVNQSNTKTVTSTPEENLGSSVVVNSDDHSNNRDNLATELLLGLAVKGEIEPSGLIRLHGTSGNLSDVSPQVSYLSNGRFVVAWEGLTSDGQGSDIFVQRFDQDGLREGDTIRLQGRSGDLLDWQPQISALLKPGAPGAHVQLDNHFAITWTGDTSDSQGWDIFVQVFNEDGDTVGEISRLRGVFGEFEDYSPQITAIDNGGFVVVWQGYTSDDDGFDIFMQKFDLTEKKIERPDEIDVYDGFTLSLEADTIRLEIVESIVSLSEGQSVVKVMGLPNGALINIPDVKSDEYNPVTIKATGSDVIGDTLTFNFVDENDIVVLGKDSDITNFSTIQIVRGTVDFTAIPEDMFNGVTILQLTADVTEEHFKSTETFVGDWYPQVIALEDSNFVVTWSGGTSDGQSYDIFSQQFSQQIADSGHTYLFPNRSYGVEGDNSDWAPQATDIANGFVVTWHGGTDNGQGRDIFVQFLHPPEPVT